MRTFWAIPSMVLFLLALVVIVQPVMASDSPKIHLDQEFTVRNSTSVDIYPVGNDTTPLFHVTVGASDYDGIGRNNWFGRPIVKGELSTYFYDGKVGSSPVTASLDCSSTPFLFGIMNSTAFELSGNESEVCDLDNDNYVSLLGFGTEDVQVVKISAISVDNIHAGDESAIIKVSLLNNDPGNKLLEFLKKSTAPASANNNQGSGSTVNQHPTPSPSNSHPFVVNSSGKCSTILGTINVAMANLLAQLSGGKGVLCEGAEVPEQPTPTISSSASVPAGSVGFMLFVDGPSRDFNPSFFLPLIATYTVQGKEKSVTVPFFKDASSATRIVGKDIQGFYFFTISQDDVSILNLTSNSISVKKDSASVCTSEAAKYSIVTVKQTPTPYNRSTHVDLLQDPSYSNHFCTIGAPAVTFSPNSTGGSNSSSSSSELFLDIVLDFSKKSSFDSFYSYNGSGTFFDSKSVVKDTTNSGFLSSTMNYGYFVSDPKTKYDRFAIFEYNLSSAGEASGYLGVKSLTSSVSNPYYRLNCGGSNSPTSLKFNLKVGGKVTCSIITEETPTVDYSQLPNKSVTVQLSFVKLDNGYARFKIDN